MFTDMLVISGQAHRETWHNMLSCTWPTKSIIFIIYQQTTVYEKVCIHILTDSTISQTVQEDFTLSLF